MIAGIGVDVVDVHRMEKWINNPEILKRFFDAEELKTAMEKGKNANLSLAARFAAKEAFGKALGTGLAGIALKDIKVKSLANGKPEMLVCGTALAALESNGAKRIHLSLTHERDNAIAMVVLENEAI